MSGQTLHSPAYAREEITAGIAHFGVGNFHRSHQAMYIDRLMQSGGNSDWGIVGIGVMPGDSHMREALANQDYRYTLIEKSGDGSITANEIGSICGFLYAPDDPEAVLSQLADPAIRIVSLTITEGGYNIDRATGEFDLTSAAIRPDLTDSAHPTTVFGYIREALRRRRDAGIAPFTVMSCDNLPGNGHVARHAVLTFTHATDPELATWIANNVTFPNSMVDRITPVTTDVDRAMVRQEFGITDAWPVVTEPFSQWVLEDHFCNGRPAFEQVGVQLTADVAPFELMKLRLLNASHQAMAYIGLMRGYTYVHEAVADPEITRFLREYLAEARATLAPVPGINVNDYIENLFVRFLNQYIADTLTRLAVDASDRIPKFVLPAIRDNLAAGRPVTAGARLVANWATWLSIANTVADPLAKNLRTLLPPPGSDPHAFIQYEPVFGDLGQNPRFAEAYLTSITYLRTNPPRQWIKDLSG